MPRTFIHVRSSRHLQLVRLCEQCYQTKQARHLSAIFDKPKFAKLSASPYKKIHWKTVISIQTRNILLCLLSLPTWRCSETIIQYHYYI